VSSKTKKRSREQQDEDIFNIESEPVPHPFKRLKKISSSDNGNLELTARRSKRNKGKNEI